MNSTANEEEKVVSEVFIKELSHGMRTVLGMIKMVSEFDDIGSMGKEILGDIAVRIEKVTHLLEQKST